MTNFKSIRIGGINREGVAITVATSFVAAGIILAGLKAGPETHPKDTPTEQPIAPRIHPDTLAAIELYSKRPKSQALITWLRGSRVSVLECSKELNIVDGIAVGGLVATTDPDKGNRERNVPGEEGEILGALPRRSTISIPRLVQVDNFGSIETWTSDASLITEEARVNQRPVFTYLQARIGRYTTDYMNLIRGKISDCTPLS